MQRNKGGIVKCREGWGKGELDDTGSGRVGSHGQQEPVSRCLAGMQAQGQEIVPFLH